ncbi:MAG: ribonuclease E/G [Planctomycetota bacterium]
MKRLLVNVVEPGECRVAIVEDGNLFEYSIEETVDRNLLGNIYLGRVVNIEPAIQAAFVDIGESRSAFLHVSDLHHAYEGASGIPSDRFREKPPEEPEKVLIQDLLRKGQWLLVQVSKAPIGNKGPSVTTYLGLPGRCLVIMVGMDRSGVSKKIEDCEQREKLREIADTLPGPENAGVIVRTAGAGQTRRELERDLRYLKQVWQGIIDQAHQSRPPALLYEESDLVIRTVRDLFVPEIEEILIDSEEVAERVREFLHKAMPRYASRVECYKGKAPLFHRFSVEKAVDTIYDRTVPLASGGSLVIDETEALVAIDVNSGRFRDEDDLEKTALQTNLEAAAEIARQLRLRDIGGVVVCDFIDMIEAKNRRELERTLRGHLRNDRAKTWFSRLSRFGIIEMTRQRLRPSKDRVGRETCRVCSGRGTVRSSRSVATGIFRQLQRGLSEGRKRAATVTVGEEVLDILVNQKRRYLVELEERYGKRILVQAGQGYRSDQYTIQYR